MNDHGRLLRADGRLGRRSLPVGRTILLLFCLFSSDPSEARADSAAQARHHDERARVYFEEGNYDFSVQEFFIVQRTAPTTSTLYNIALCFQRLGRTDDEFNYLSEYLAGKDSNEERRAFAEERLSSLTPQVARVFVESEPPGAAVYIDREELGAFGTTPAVMALPPGKHRVIVRRDGYLSGDLEVLAEAGREVKARLPMKLVVGLVSIMAPSGAEVSLRSPKGELVAVGAAPFTASVPPGDYRLEVLSSAHKNFRGIVHVEASETIEVNPDLEMLPPPTGEITFTSNVPGALVSVDGKPAGFAPLTLPGLAVGEHQIEMSKQGRLPWTGKVELVQDERAWLTSTLEEPVQKPIPTWALWTTGGLGAAGLLNAGVFGILTASTHHRYEQSLDPALSERGKDFALVADISLVTGAVFAATAFVFYVINGPQLQRDSAATVSEGD
jgi:outer membrane receptor for ferrienterochelin and colicins